MQDKGVNFSAQALIGADWTARFQEPTTADQEVIKAILDQTSDLVLDLPPGKQLETIDWSELREVRATSLISCELNTSLHGGRLIRNTEAKSQLYHAHLWAAAPMGQFTKEFVKVKTSSTKDVERTARVQTGHLVWT